MEEVKKYLKPTPMIDCDSSAIQEKANELTRGQEGIEEKAKILFRYVRDEIKNESSPNRVGKN